MLGAIIGDIVGSRWEFNPTNDYNFEWLTQSKNDFTDDSICTIAVADALLRGLDFGQSLHDWCRKYPYPMGGYGGRFSQWVMSMNPEPYESFGNGAAMRVSPVAYWYDELSKVLETAAATAMPTHNHREGIKGAQTVALAIFKAISYPRNEAPMHLDEILTECVNYSGYDIEMPKSKVMNKFDETCQGTVPVALKIISMATDFEDAVRLAVSLGADADTLGAIVGSMAEAIWGIPMTIRKQFKDRLPLEMNEVIDLFHYKCPKSLKPRIDICYAGNDFSKVSWGILAESDFKELRNEQKLLMAEEFEQKRKVMAERAKARDTW